VSRTRLTVEVDQSQVSARIGHALANDETKTSSATGDDAYVAIEGEARKSRLDVLAASAMDRLAAGQLAVVRIFDLDVGVCS
jgi:hypothetical protein